VKPPSNLNACLKTKISEVEIFAGVIEPGFTAAIDTSGNVAKRRVGARTETSGPSSARMRDGRGTAESPAQTFRSEVVIGTIKRHDERKVWKVG
jgi:hypothetical protein